ncbi:MAG: ATP synthase F1 subunit gamma [Erysipelotrichaceae bacterium]|nr:ATP synthase F1 subunit gamma [Erysipelotrichaceae bacterium]
MAGQSRQALRSRIKSVQNTQKITKAMEMISNAKLVRQRAKMEANREYANRLKETVDEIVSSNPDAESKYLVKHGKSENKMTIVFCSDLGLCGGYNANIMKLARNVLNPEDPVYVIGTSLYHQFVQYGFHVMNEEPVSSDKLTFSELREITAKGIDMYQKDEISTLQILRTEFINTMTFTPSVETLLPCTAGDHNKENKSHVETLFEPDPQTILDTLIPMMIQDTAYSCWMESTTAEQGSRRVAMKTASDNADDLSSSLKLAYNKARQAAITQEITEIVSGSNAV